MAKYTKIDVLRMGARDGENNFTLLQALIDNNPGKKIIIPEGMTCYTDQVLRPIANTCLEVNGTLSAMPGFVRPLQQDAAIGTDVIYVDNSDGVFKVGQYVSLSSDVYPTGGSGNVPRRIAQSDKIAEAYADRLVLAHVLQPKLISLDTPDLLVSDNAMVGHSASILYYYEIDNVVLSGTGTIDGQQPTMHNVYPYSIDSDDEEFFLIEEVRAGNVVFFSGCNNVTIRGKSNDQRLRIQEANLATVYLNIINACHARYVDCYHPYMKHWALGDLTNSIIEDSDCLGSYNEDGIALHHNVSGCVFRNIDITDTYRAGLLVGSNAHDNRFEDINITNSKLSLYPFVSGSQTDCNNNYFKNINVTNCEFGPVFQRCTNAVLDNLTVSFIKTTGHCLTIVGGCSLTFNGGGVYDTKLISNPDRGTGILTDAPLSGHGESTATFNNFEIVRTKKAFWKRGGSPTITLNSVTVNENQALGDIADPVFVHNETTVDGDPYP